MIRKIISDVLAEHEYGWYRPDETAGPSYHGLMVDERTKEAENLQWRCGCGWTTLDHHNGTSKWSDHCDHVSDKVVAAVRSYRMIDTFARVFE